jgi:glutaredoxin-like protein NrdH
LSVQPLDFSLYFGYSIRVPEVTFSHLNSLLKGVFAMAKITLFSKNNCMQCKMTKKFLEKENADFEEINIDEHPEKIDYVKSLGFTAAPVIESGDIVFSGFQPAKLKEIL